MDVLRCHFITEGSKLTITQCAQTTLFSHFPLIVHSLSNGNFARVNSLKCHSFGHRMPHLQEGSRAACPSRLWYCSEYVRGDTDVNGVPSIVPSETQEGRPVTLAELSTQL